MLLDVKNLDVRIGPTSILRQVNLQVRQGQIVGLAGRNGAGKTTLMRTVMGLLAVDNGSVMFDGQELAKMPAYRRTSLGMGFAPRGSQTDPRAERGREHPPARLGPEIPGY